MEGFATGFIPTQATKPGFAVENQKFRVTFDGVSLLQYLINSLEPASFKVMCNDVKNIISHGFETCYDWRPVLELLLEAACEDYYMIQVVVILPGLCMYFFYLVLRISRGRLSRGSPTGSPLSRSFFKNTNPCLVFVS